MGKPASGEKNGLKKGPWTPEEDQKLIDYIQNHGHGKWRTLPKNAGLKRCGKSCRLRWTNYLRPDIKRGGFSFDEEETIIQLHSVLGNKWSTIAANLPGRTDNEIKNYWNTHIKKRLMRMGIDPVTHTPCLDMLQLSSLLNSSLLNSYSSQLNYPGQFGMGNMVNPSMITSLLAALLSSQSRNNPEIANQVFQQNQLSNSNILVQNQCQSSDQQMQHNNSLQSFQPNNLQVPIQENQYSCNALNMESQLMKAKTDQFTPNLTNFSHQDNLPDLWQYNEQPESAATENFSPPRFNSIMNSLLENHISHESHNINDQSLPNFSLMNSLLSSTTSSLSPSRLNSSSSTTFVNGATEDERDTYCSNNMLMYNISSNGLNDHNGLL